MIYLFLFFLVLYPVLRYDRPLALNSQHGIESQYPNTANKYYWFLLIVFILFAGLRNKVGLDTYSYMEMWDYEIPNFKQLNLAFFVLAKYQPLWYVVNSGCKSIIDDFFLFQFIHACFVNTIIFYFVNKHAPYRFTVIFLYYLYFYMNFNCEIMRESLAVCMFLLAYDAFVEKKWKKYYCLTFVAFMFHASAMMLFLFPLGYNMLSKKLNLKYLILISLVILVLINGGLLEAILNVISPLWAESFIRHGKMENATILGDIRSIVQVSLIVYMYILWSRNICNNEKMLYGMRLYVIIIIVGITFRIAETRLSNYLKIFYIITLCEFFWHYYNKKKNFYIICIYSLFVFSLYRYYFRDVSSWVGKDSQKYYFYEAYYPYYSISEEVPFSVDMHRKAIHDQEYQKEMNQQ